MAKRTYLGLNIDCPLCGEHNCEVIDTRRRKMANEIRRQRKCKRCGFRFRTIEYVDQTFEDYSI